MNQPMNRMRLFLLPLLALPLVAAAPDGRIIADHGNGNGGPACVTCHGENFQGNAAIGAPALAGLPAAEILARLAHYAGPHGHNAMMRAVAVGLDPGERQAVADYLASLKPSP
jgi:cytochrome c553